MKKILFLVIISAFTVQPKAGLSSGALFDMNNPIKGLEMVQSININISDEWKEIGEKIDEADELIEENKYDEVISLYQGMIDNPKEILYKDTSKKAFFNVKEYCQRKISELPKEAKNAYIDKYGKKAKDLYEKAVKSDKNSIELYKETARRFLHTREGILSLKALGEVAYKNKKYEYSIFYFNRAINELEDRDLKDKNEILSGLKKCLQNSEKENVNDNKNAGFPLQKDPESSAVSAFDGDVKQLNVTDDYICVSSYDQSLFGEKEPRYKNRLTGPFNSAGANILRVLDKKDKKTLWSTKEKYPEFNYANFLFDGNYIYAFYRKNDEFYISKLYAKDGSVIWKRLLFLGKGEDVSFPAHLMKKKISSFYFIFNAVGFDKSTITVLEFDSDSSELLSIRSVVAEPFTRLTGFGDDILTLYGGMKVKNFRSINIATNDEMSSIQEDIEIKLVFDAHNIGNRLIIAESTKQVQSSGGWISAPENSDLMKIYDIKSGKQEFKWELAKEFYIDRINIVSPNCFAVITKEGKAYFIDVSEKKEIGRFIDSENKASLAFCNYKGVLFCAAKDKIMLWESK